MQSFLRYGATAVFIALATQSQAGLITVTSNNVTSSVGDGGTVPTSVASDTSSETSIPTIDTVSASVGANESTTTYEFSQTTEAASLEFDWDHMRTGVARANAYSGVSLAFTANADATYDISAFYDMTGDHEIRFFAQLFDQTTGIVRLLRNSQESKDTLDETFLLGETGGDESNLQEGSLTGSLASGHEYVLNFNMSIQAIDFGLGGVTSTGATAEGSLNLTITESPAAQPVPEPSTLALLGLGGLGLCGSRWRRKQQATAA